MIKYENEFSTFPLQVILLSIVFQMNQQMFQMLYHLKVCCLSLAVASNIFYDLSKNYDAKYVIDTPGCRIPNIHIAMPKNKTKMPLNYCGKRLISVKKIPIERVKFQYNQGNLQNCQYRFMFASSHDRRIDMDVLFDSWSPFYNGTQIKLKSDFIEVQCIQVTHNEEILYEDVYGKIKKVNKTRQSNDRRHWNVLVIGMDTMSRTRALYELPKTVAYFRKAGWMDFKAYNKIAENTLPNVLSILTNKNMTTLNRRCQLDMYPCNEAFIWSRFKANKYATAYGDDQSMACFKKQPTDHYLKTLFLTKQQNTSKKNCLKRMQYAEHVLSYAHDFMDAYKQDKFFGYFWLTTLSHESNREQSPSMFDAQLSSFFRKLNSLDIFDNTFLIFHSDHGFRFTNKKNLESYYESRLPMFFMRVPSTFRQKYPEKYVNLYLQQRRLIVPFDFHLTLLDIATNFTKNRRDFYHEGCAQCTSLFQKFKPTRTCADAGIEETWCACRELKSVSIQNDNGAYHSLALIMLRLHNITKSIQTKKFTRCHELSLSKLLRVHTFRERSKIFHVIAGTLGPDETGFEAAVSNLDSKYKIVSLEITTSYERPIQCALKKDERVWCVCETLLRK